MVSGRKGWKAGCKLREVRRIHNGLNLVTVLTLDKVCRS